MKNDAEAKVFFSATNRYIDQTIDRRTVRWTPTLLQSRPSARLEEIWRALKGFLGWALEGTVRDFALDPGIFLLTFKNTIYCSRHSVSRCILS